MSRLLLTFCLTSITLLGSARADVRFISPLEGSQTIGDTILEVTSTTPAIDRVEFFVDGRLVGAARKPPFRAQYDFGDGGTARTVEAVVQSAGYTRSERSAIRTSGLSAAATANVDLVEVAFHTSAIGVPKPTDLRIRENGVLQSVREVLASRPPSRFVFLVDTSLSMSGGKLTAALGGVRAATNHLRDGDEAFVILFNHRVSSAVAIGDLKREVIPSGGTSLRDALLAIDPAKRTIAIVISDGGDRNSLASTEQALAALSRSNVSVHSLLLGEGSGASVLQQLADRTGGRTVRTIASKLAGDLDAAMRAINSRYVAVYQSSTQARGWRSIELSSPKFRTGATRQGYQAR